MVVTVRAHTEGGRTGKQGAASFLMTYWSGFSSSGQLTCEFLVHGEGEVTDYVTLMGVVD